MPTNITPMLDRYSKYDDIYNYLYSGLLVRLMMKVTQFPCFPTAFHPNLSIMKRAD